MKKARSNVVGVNSPEKRSTSIALRRSAIPGKREAGSRPRARRSRSARGFGSGPCSPAVLVTRAVARPGEGVRSVGSLAGERFEQDEAEGVDVGADLPGLAPLLLGRQVALLLGRQEVRAAQGRPQAQSLHLHVPVERDGEALGRDEAVEDRGARVALLAVQELERDRRPARDHQGVVGGEREALGATAILDRRDRASLDELGGHVHGLLDPADAEHAHQPRALEPRRESRFVHQALGGVGVRGDLGPEAQDGDETVEAGGAEARGPVLAPERTRAGLLEEDELAELLPEGHGRSRSGCRGR